MTVLFSRGLIALKICVCGSQCCPALFLRVRRRRHRNMAPVRPPHCAGAAPGGAEADACVVASHPPRRRWGDGGGSDGGGGGRGVSAERSGAGGRSRRCRRACRAPRGEVGQGCGPREPAGRADGGGGGRRGELLVAPADAASWAGLRVCALARSPSRAGEQPCSYVKHRGCSRLPAALDPAPVPVPGIGGVCCPPSAAQEVAQNRIKEPGKEFNPFCKRLGLRRGGLLL